VGELLNDEIIIIRSIISPPIPNLAASKLEVDYCNCLFDRLPLSPTSLAMLLQLFSRKPSHKFQKLDDSSRSSSNTTMDSSSNMIATPSVKLTRASSYDYESSSGGGGISSTNSATRGGICIVGSGDSGSNNNNTRSQASSELLYDQLCNMIAQEERDGYKCCDYLSYYPGRSPSSSSTDIRKSKSSKTKGIDEGCRTSICGWMYRVADHFAIDREGKLQICFAVIAYILCTFIYVHLTSHDISSPSSSPSSSL